MTEGEQRLLRVVGALLVVLLLVPVLAFGLEATLFAAHTPGLVSAVEQVAGPICHHLPERTPSFGDRPAPVCARCLGMYAAAAAAGPAGLALGARRTLGPAAIVLAGGFAIGLLAAIAEAIGVVGTGNAARFALGAGLGAAPTGVAGLGARTLLQLRAPNTTAATLRT